MSRLSISENQSEDYLLKNAILEAARRFYAYEQHMAEFDKHVLNDFCCVNKVKCEQISLFSNNFTCKKKDSNT